MSRAEWRCVRQVNAEATATPNPQGCYGSICLLCFDPAAHTATPHGYGFKVSNIFHPTFSILQEPQLRHLRGCSFSFASRAVLRRFTNPFIER